MPTFALISLGCPKNLVDSECMGAALCEEGFRMVQEPHGADVVVVNPTHYAVALKWSRLPGEAPICVAKGVDEIAARIREVAAESGVPIHRDPPTARAIHATVEVGREIHPDHYKAIAAAIRFAEEMRRRMKAGPGIRQTPLGSGR